MNLFRQDTNPLFDYSTIQAIQKRKPRPKFDRPRHDIIQPDNPSIRLIPLTREQNAIVDATDYEWLMQWNWCVRQSSYNVSVFYACRAHGRKWTTMHRAIMGDPVGLVVDHINGNTLDNRRRNLRTITQTQNMWNWRSRNGRHLRGVTKTQSGKWKAAINLGSFDTEEEAAMMYDKIALIVRGEFAILNFPKD